MVEVIALCEGSTERDFCNEVVAPELTLRGIELKGTLVGKPDRKRGGIRNWPAYRLELVRLANERAGRHVAVLVDYYAMPHSWPGRADAAGLPTARRGMHVEDAVRSDLKELHGRFHPCVQLHEFESLLFVEPDLSALSIAIGSNRPDASDAIRAMKEIKASCKGLVEEINDRPQCTPCRRLKDIFPGYDKVAWGVMAAKDVTLRRLRAGCPWLDRWVTTLEKLAGE